MLNDNSQKINDTLTVESFKNKNDRYNPLRLLKEVLFSFIVSLLPALFLMMYYISNNLNASGSEVVLWLVKAILIVTLIIFIFRMIMPRKFLQIIGLVFIGSLIVWGLFREINEWIVCHDVGGKIGDYNNFSHEALIRDIHGNILSEGVFSGEEGLNICFVPQEIVPTLLGKKSFFYKSVTFVVK